RGKRGKRGIGITKERGRAHLPNCTSFQLSLTLKDRDSDSTILTCSQEGGLAPALSFHLPYSNPLSFTCKYFSRSAGASAAAVTSSARPPCDSTKRRAVSRRYMISSATDC